MNTAPTFSEGPPRLHFLDSLRGLAALYVVIGHARYLLHEGFSSGYQLHPESYTFWEKITVYALGIFGWGHEAVILFFVLSGFAIHLRYAREQIKFQSQAKLNPRQYFWRRSKRLYPPLFFALALTFGLDTLAAHLHFPIHDSIGAVSHDARTLIGNLAFTMDNSGGTPFSVFGTNKALWSLRYEAYFYLLYPLLWFINRKSPWMAVSATWTLALLFALSPQARSAIPSVIRQPLELLCVWWLGGLLADIYVKRIRCPLFPLTCFALLLPLGLRLHGTNSALLPHPYATWCVGLGFFGLMAAGLFWHQLLDKWRAIIWLGKLGDCSYTLYVIHVPILVFISGWLMARSPNGKQLPINPIWVVLAPPTCLLFAWLAHFLVEKPLPFKRRTTTAPLS